MQFAPELLKIPPVTRFLCATQLAVSLPVLLNVVPPFNVVLLWRPVLERLQVIFLFVDSIRDTKLGWVIDMANFHEFLSRT